MISSKDPHVSIHYKCAIFFILFLFINVAYAQNTASIYQKSSISFSIKSFGINVNGTFKQPEIEVAIDTLVLANSFIKAKIHVASIETGISKRDKHLLEEKFFGQGKYPDILFESSSIERSGKDAYAVKGQINIKGVLKNISIPFQLTSKNKESLLNAEFEVNRLDFGVGDKSWTMSDIVKIAVSFTIKN